MKNKFLNELDKLTPYQKRQTITYLAEGLIGGYIDGLLDSEFSLDIIKLIMKNCGLNQTEAEKILSDWRDIYLRS